MKKAIFLISLVVSLSPIQIVLAHASIPTAPTTACNIIGSTDLTTHVSNQIDSRLAVATSTNTQLYLSRPMTSTTTAGVRNTDVWSQAGASPIDFTGVAAWNTQASNLRGGTLISPRHVIMASHFAFGPPYEAVFYDSNGDAVSRQVISAENIPGTDFTIGLLDSDVPDSITYYPIVASTTLRNMLEQTEGQTLNVPIVSFDAAGKALVHQLLDVVSNDTISHTPYTSGTRSLYSEAIVVGDSGQPNFMIIDGRPVFLTVHTGAGSGQDAGAFINELNMAMTSLGGGYQVTEYQPTCFTEYDFNYNPIITNSVTPNYFQLYTYEHVSSTVPIHTVTATAPEVGQTISFSLDSLTSNAIGTLNPSDYFNINSNTGGLFQTHDLNIGRLGSTLSMYVKATDNGTYVASSTMLYSINIRTNPTAQIRIVKDPNFVISNLPVTPNRGPGLTGFTFGAGNSVVVTGNFGGTPQGISKLNFDGSLNTAFNSAAGSGLADSTNSLINTSYGITSDNSGKYILYATRNSKYNNVQTGALIRLNSDGTLDADFTSGAGTGITSADNTGGLNKAISIGSKILVAGKITEYNGTPTHNVVMVNSDGTLDTTFTNNFGVGFSPLQPQDMLSDGSGHIYMGGNFTSYTPPSNATTTVGAITKFSTAGVFDSTFASAIGTGFNGSVNALVLRSDGKILVGGQFTSFNGTPVNNVAVLNPDGTLDTSFATNIGTGFNGSITALSVKSDNSFYAGGTFTSFNGVTTNSLTRINADGTLDTRFNTAMANGINGTVTKIAERSDGAIGVSGRFDLNGTYTSFLILTTDTPVAPSVPDLLSAYDSGTSNVDNQTYDTSLVFSGTGSSTAVIYLYDEGTLLGTTSVSDSGVWYATSTLAVGTHNISAKQSLLLTNTATSSLSNSLVVYVLTPVSSGGGGGGSGGGGTPGIIYYNRGNPKDCLPGNKFSSLTGMPCNASTNALTTFTKNLSLGYKDAEVLNLQKFLNTHGFIISKVGVGSLGNESTYFGGLTKISLQKFQKASSITPVSGFFGPLTRSKVNEILSKTN